MMSNEVLNMFIMYMPAEPVNFHIPIIYSVVRKKKKYIYIYIKKKTLTIFNIWKRIGR